MNLIFNINYLKVQKNAFLISLLLAFTCKCFLSKSQCGSLSLFAQSSAVNCQTGLTSGTVSVLNGTAPYSYTWLPTGGNSSVAVNIAPNTYTILVKDVNGCGGTTNLIINNTTNVSIQFSSIPNNCFGQSNGQITANVIGSPGPFNYTWTPAAPNTSVITNLASGTYSLAVGDANGCTYSGSVMVTSPPLITASITTKPISCHGALSNASVTTAGGNPPYTFSWSPSAGSNSVISNIVAGNYSVSITDNNGCSSTYSVLITEPPPFQNTLTLTHVSCNTFSNGSASSNLIGGTPAYSYSWIPTTINASSVSGLTAGSYTLLVKDVKNCIYTETFVISQPAPLTTTLTHTDEFCINADGSATITVNGGNGSYTYTWSTSPIQTNSVATNLAAGNYTVIISDLKNCKTQAAVTIGNISNLIGSISSYTNSSCNSLCNGVATASISGGNAPYSYNWISIPGSTNQTATNLCAGTYTVKITDNLGCYTTTTVQISEPSPITYSIGGTNIICSGNFTSLTSSVSGGSPGYSYNWQPGSFTTNSITVNPSITTGYSLTVTDKNGCSGAVLVYSVLVNAPLSLNPSATNIQVCPNIVTPISVSANGGDGNYSYLWQPGNLTANSITVNVQSTTIYTITISDGCGSNPVNGTVAVNVYPIANPNFTVNSNSGCEPFCAQFNNLTTGTTTALWTFGDFSPPVQSPAATHCYNKAGIYHVKLTVTNMFGCQTSITKSNYITVHAKPLADFVQKNKFITLPNNKGVFENSSVNATSFKWSLDGVYLSSQKDLEHLFFDIGCFNLNLIANNSNACSDTTEKEICVTEGFNFWMPNAFSPDNDGKNDFLIPKGTGWLDEGYSLEIYNRWGNLIFKTNSVSAFWDGKVSGSKSTDDIYVWKVHIKDIYDNEHDLNGHVLIMR